MSKLTEAKNLVDDLKRKAGEQSILLAEKQQEADAALKEITVAMQVGKGDLFVIVVRVWGAPVIGQRKSAFALKPG